MRKLAIIITHPIQYYVPLFQLLAKECELKVFYTWGEKGAAAKYDPDFKKIIAWDVPLLEGYAYQFLKNVAKDPGSHHYKGIVNPTLINQIKDFNPTALLVYGWAYQSHLKILRYFKGKIPIWFRGDSNLIDEKQGFKRILRHLFLSWVYQHIDKVFYVGTANKHYYEKLGLKPNQLIFAPHAIDNDRFALNRKMEAVTLRMQLNISDDDILILFAGKLERKKNPELLLQAFIASTSSFEKQKTENGKQASMHLLIVGNGVLEDQLKSQISNLKSQHVHFMDFQNQSQMPVIYQACDLFCLPSSGPGETWGLAANEAMACGKAILISDKVGCATDLVENGNNGYIFKSDNLDDLKSKLTLMISSKQNLIIMGMQSAKLIKNWTIALQAKAILKELKN